MSGKTKRDAIASLMERGLNRTEISKQLGIPRTTVRYWAEKIQAEDTYNDIAVDSGNWNDKGDLDPASPKQIWDYIDQLSPIDVVNAPRIKPITTNGDVAVVIGDTHFGMEDQPTLEIFYEVLDELKPDTVIINGDTVDLMAVSKYPKDVRYTVDLIDERIAYHKFCAQVRDIVGSKANLFETDANHSGNGVEGRWWRYLSEILGPVASLPEALDALSYDKMFIPSDANIDLVEYVELCNGNLFVMHGDVVRKHGGYSARGMLDKWFTSIIMNHTHRFGVTSQRIPAIGSRREQNVTVYENACACDLTPCYASAPNWQNGFSIVSMDGDNFGVEPVIVTDRKAVVCTLGKTIAV
jgi:metallophosphoesterase superfamily enzyme